MDGSSVAIYIDPDGNAGLLTSNDVFGNYYMFYEDSGEEEGVWGVTGNFTPTPMVSVAELGITPENLEWNIEDGYLYAEVYGVFDYANFGEVIFGEGDSYIEGYDVWSETTFIYDGKISQPWGIYDMKLAGEYTYYNPGDSTVWFALIEGDGEFGYRDEEGWDFWIGGMGGIWQDGEILGTLRALYITDEDNTGLVKGDVFGLYNEDEVESDYGTWIGESIGTFTEMGTTEDWEIDYSEFSGTGLGSFEGDGTLEDVSVEGISFNIFDQDWGIWAAGLNGTYTGLNSPFRLAIGYILDMEDSPEPDKYTLGTIDGDWGLGELSGSFRGITLYESDNVGKIGASMAEGDVIGNYIDVDEFGTGTWQAAGIGEWVEVTDLLTPGTEGLGFTMDQLEQFIMAEVPITETYYASLVAGSQGFITAAAMDFSLYNNWLWTALIYGMYEGDSTDWAVTLSEGTDSVTLDGTIWDEETNEWLADVSGVVDGNNITGEAGGSWGDGEFEGIGAGTVGGVVD